MGKNIDDFKLLIWETVFLKGLRDLEILSDQKTAELLKDLIETKPRKNIVVCKKSV